MQLTCALYVDTTISMVQTKTVVIICSRYDYINVRQRNKRAESMDPEALGQEEEKDPEEREEKEEAENLVSFILAASFVWHQDYQDCHLG